MRHAGTIGYVAITARIERHGLIAAECLALTGGSPGADGVARCRAVERVGRAAFVQRGIVVLGRASSLAGLLDDIGDRIGADVDTERFRVDVHDPERRAPVGRTSVSAAVAECLSGQPDLDSPLHRFQVVVGRDDMAFGEVVAVSDASYRRHDDKPWTTSSSLDSRFARGLINLVPDATSILDPCCGAGSIVVEAASLGLDAAGVDWKPAMVGMTRENLAHFGYAATVERADSREEQRQADAVVTDLPYGHAIDSDETQIRAILARSAMSAPTGVFVTPTDISGWLLEAGYGHVAVHTVTKRRGFTRWIHVAHT